MTLTDAAGTTHTTTTTEEGTYTFTHLPDGTYTVSVDTAGPLAGMDQTQDPDTTVDHTTTNLLIDAATTTHTGKDFGYLPNNTISGTIYRDDNRDKTHNPTEEGIEGIRVDLQDTTGTTLHTLNTAPDGTYAFQHLPEGTYTIRVTRNNTITDYDQTQDPDTTPDDTTTNLTIDTTHTQHTNITFGYVPNYTISGTIYNDTDAYANYNTPDTPHPNIPIDLINNEGTITHTTTTNTDGTYQFTHLPAGTYTIHVHTEGTLTGHTQTQDPDNTPDNTTHTTLTHTHPTTTNLNFGYTTPNTAPTAPTGTVTQTLARTGFGAPIGAGIGAGIMGGLFLWMRRRRR